MNVDPSALHPDLAVTHILLLQKRECKGFSVGHKMEAHTMGLWIRLRKHPRNPNLTIIFLDTEVTMN